LNLHDDPLSIPRAQDLHRAAVVNMTATLSKQLVPDIVVTAVVPSAEGCGSLPQRSPIPNDSECDDHTGRFLMVPLTFTYAPLQ
jgi:hypothetical protein